MTFYLVHEVKTLKTQRLESDCNRWPRFAAGQNADQKPLFAAIFPRQWSEVVDAGTSFFFTGFPLFCAAEIQIVDE